MTRVLPFCLLTKVSYNAENGHPSCANDFLLNTVQPASLHFIDTGFKSALRVQILRGEFKSDAGRSRGRDWAVCIENDMNVTRLAVVTSDCGAVENLKVGRLIAACSSDFFNR